MMAMDDDSMSTVTGGLGVVDGLPQDARNTAMRVRSRSMGAGAGNGVPSGVGIPLVKAKGASDDREYVNIYCPFCKEYTDHLYFSGGRVECTVCQGIYKG